MATVEELLKAYGLSANELEKPRSPAQAFNKMYRERRLAAQSKGEVIVSYNEALLNLIKAITEARRHGEVADINQFWDKVFKRQKKA